MEENQARLCPKCGTPLMEDNFCMGCGTYVDPDSGAAKGKDSVVGYGESDSFGSFGVSPAADPTGIIGESGTTGGYGTDNGYGANSGNNVTGDYGTTGYGTTGNYGNAGTYDSTGNYGNAGGYQASGNYDNAGGQNGNPSASAARGYSDKPSFLASVLVMAGIACAIFLAIFVTDSVTKLKQQSAKYVSPEQKEGITEYWQMDYKGDQVLQVQDIVEISLYGESDVNIGVYKGELEDECRKRFDAYPTISYEVTSTGSTVSMVITYGKLDKKDGMQAIAKVANITMSSNADHISAKSMDKSLLKSGWKKR